MISTVSPNVIIIGAGLAGLASAVELRRRGCGVVVVDRNEHAGGKMNVLSEGGFTFDMGPTIITLPDVLLGILQRAGRDPSEYINLVNLDPQWRCFYEDGTVLDLHQDVDRMVGELDRLFPGQGTGQGWREFITFSRRMYRLSERVFFYRDVGGIGDVMRQTPFGDVNLLKDVLGMRLHSTVGATAHRLLRGEPHACQLAEHFLQYVGSSPFLAPAILSLIAAAQVDHGCWYPMGGTREVAGSLERMAREQGVDFKLGRSVERMLTDGDRAVGVELDGGEQLHADAIVSNCDIQRTYSGLVGGELGKTARERVAKDYEPACSGVVLYLGLNRQYDHLAHHNFLFSRDSASEFDDIYRRGVPAQDPTLYIAAPSRTDPAQAPEGGEALYILIHTAYARDAHRWNGPGGMLQAYRPVIIDKLRRMGMEDIEAHIVVERHLTPNDIDRMYNAVGGAIYGLASHGRLKGGFKPRNRSRHLRNLYLAGGSVNPGPGVPMVLMSGVTAAESLAADFGLADNGDRKSEEGAAEWKPESAAV